ncbi:MAG: ApaG domain [Chloroherpetonaceae bacterium]|nr:ApaG domain [Chloroherpetonaceae bacterium]
MPPTFENEFCRVTIEKLEEISPSRIQPPFKFGYAYTISIENISEYVIQIQNRKWVVRDGDMKDKIVEGEGVVGEKPILKPGEKFVYQSFHVMLSRFGSATGSYFGVFTDAITTSVFQDESLETDSQPQLEGNPFEVSIPEFLLIHREIPQ